jgi:RNA polymerase sigma-70 factor (ECF subfamily)
MTADAVAAPTFGELYDAHVAFVWRNLRRLGVEGSALDDATQDVFLVLHRRIAELPPDAVRGWLFGVTRRVASDYRRSVARRGAVALDAAPPAVSEGSVPERLDAARIVAAALATLRDEQRDVLILADLEQLAAPEISVALGVGLNTVYSRLRLARAEFERQVSRHMQAPARRGPGAP